MPVEPREDLAAMCSRIARDLGEAEAPLLEASGVTMWEYIVLSRLAEGSVPNQLTLAHEVRHDKTRLIKLLDGLEGRGLVDRARDPSDRRSQTVAITDDGRRVQRGVRDAIRTMEQDLLGVLTATERRVLLRALPKLYRSG